MSCLENYGLAAYNANLKSIKDNCGCMVLLSFDFYVFLSRVGFKLARAGKGREKVWMQSAIRVNARIFLALY